jgi:hypothetical protein
MQRAQSSPRSPGEPARSGRAHRLVAALIAAALALLAASLTVSAATAAQVESGQSADRWVTIAARECDSYADIRANLARNDLMESLEDLGADTLYEAGEPIDPRIELAGQPKCRPLVGWRFTFGAGIAGEPVEGPWGSLSIVTDPDGGQQPVTKASVPARDFEGNPVGGGAKVDGAVTIGLDHDQVERATGNTLWLQGGTPADPALYADPQFAGRYGFGALRCAIDDLNGDNVETIQFPAGTRHMYCYAYYVTPPPSAGTIVIRKELVGSEAPQSFHFTGNLSYNDGGAFDLSASDGEPGSVEFTRAETGPGEEPWRAVEERSEGWTLTDVSCASQKSVTTTDLAKHSAEIRLVAGDVVTCTFVNRLTPPAGALVLRKVTHNGAGAFPFRVRDQNGNVVARRGLTTREPGGIGALSAIELDPGRYRVEERRPATSEGVWRLSDVSCNGTRRPPGKPVLVDVSAASGSVCTFTNTLDRPGRIDIGTISLGGLGTAGYIVTPADDPSVQRRQLATTERQGATAPARGQSTHDLPFGRYVIQETAIAASQRLVWSLIAVVCNGQPVPFEQGRAVVRITRAEPAQSCRFVNLRQRQPPPPPEPGPAPGPNPPPGPNPAPGPSPVPGGPTPDLALEKELVRIGGGPTPALTFRLGIANHSAVTASRVVVADRLAAGTTLLAADPSQGSCFTRGPRLLICTLGDLAPRQRANVRVRVRRLDPQAGVNVAVVGTSSPEDALRNNLDAVRLEYLKRPTRPPQGACRTSTPVAHASC